MARHGHLFALRSTSPSIIPPPRVGSLYFPLGITRIEVDVSGLHHLTPLDRLDPRGVLAMLGTILLKHEIRL